MKNPAANEACAGNREVRCCGESVLSEVPVIPNGKREIMLKASEIFRDEEKNDEEVHCRRGKT
jgi:hypothetical protein